MADCRIGGRKPQEPWGIFYNKVNKKIDRLNSAILEENHSRETQNIPHVIGTPSHLRVNQHVVDLNDPWNTLVLILNLQVFMHNNV